MIPTVNIEVPNTNPVWAAAYRVLFEACSPHECTSDERRAAIATYFAEVLVWAKSQDPEVMSGYEWAIQSIMRDVDRRVAAAKFACDCVNAYKTVPRPPSQPVG